MGIIFDFLTKAIEWFRSLRIPERFEALDKRKKFLIIILGLSLLFSLYYRMYFTPSVNSVKKSKADLASLGSKISEVKAKIPDITLAQSDLSRSKIEYENLQDKLASIEDSLPGSDSIPLFLGELVKQGSGLEIDFVSIKPQSLKSGEQYARLNVEVKVETSYNNFLNYVHRLENISKFLSPVSVGIEEAKDQTTRGTISGTVVLSTLLGGAKGTQAALKPTAEIKDLKLGRSPFTSGVQNQGNIKKYVISGINYMGGEKIVIINDNAYRLGDEIDNMPIKKILPNMVILYDKANNEDFAITLSGERSTDAK